MKYCCRCSNTSNSCSYICCNSSRNCVIAEIIVVVVVVVGIVVVAGYIEHMMVLLLLIVILKVRLGGVNALMISMLNNHCTFSSFMFCFAFKESIQTVCRMRLRVESLYDKLTSLRQEALSVSAQCVA